jgi:hypothetical protein
MRRGVRWYLVGSIVLLVLAGCGRTMFVQREAWREQAEASCIKTGTVKEGPGLVRISPINGPGVCGAQYPLKVTLLGERTSLAYADELRPPGAIPGATRPNQPRWPINEPRTAPPQRNVPVPYEPSDAPSPRSVTPNRPLSLEPPNDPNAPRHQPYDFRKPFSVTKRPAAPPPANEDDEDEDDEKPARPGKPPVIDMSPEPYLGRKTFERPQAPRRQPPNDVARTPKAFPSPAPAPVVPLSPSRAPRFTGTITPVEIKPAATLACPLVSALDQWIVNDMQPAAMRWFGQPVAEIKQISAYSCRGMNGNPRARISEHAFGNALDIASFTLADGRVVTVQKGWHGAPEEQGFLRDIQGAACERFHTVLAPGSNRFHYDHIHVDLMRRGSGRGICNPAAIAGEVVAARARERLAKNGRDLTVTGSIKRPSPASKKPLSFASEKKLPPAQPGSDDADEEEDEE